MILLIYTAASNSFEDFLSMYPLIVLSISILLPPLYSFFDIVFRIYYYHIKMNIILQEGGVAFWKSSHRKSRKKK